MEHINKGNLQPVINHIIEAFDENYDIKSSQCYRNDKQQEQQNKGQIPSLTLRENHLTKSNKILPVKLPLKFSVEQNHQSNQINFNDSKEVVNDENFLSLNSNTLQNFESEEENLLDDISFDKDLELRKTRDVKEEEGDIELFELYKRTLDFEIEQISHPNFSILNPVTRFVTVEPPRLGKPLLPNHAPLDLSCVKKIYSNYPPLNEEDEENLSKDEIKLYSILDYELKQIGSSLNWKDSKYVKDEDETVPYKEKNFFKEILKYLFANKEENYETKYPWYKIANDIENPKVSTVSNSNNFIYDGPKFERNNTDMFPIWEQNLFGNTR